MYGLPFDGETTGLFYRKDLFEAAGIAAPPTTWEELEAAAQALTTEGQYGYIIFAPEAAYYWYPYLWQNGGELLSEDGTTILFNSDAGRKRRSSTSVWRSTRRPTSSTPTPTMGASPSPPVRSPCTWPGPGSPR